MTEKASTYENVARQFNTAAALMGQFIPGG